MKKIAILGAGFMGSATAWPLSDNGHQVHLIGTHLDQEIISHCKDTGEHPRLKRPLPPAVTPYFLEELEEALDGVDFIVSGVNSMGVRWIGRTLAPYLKAGDKVIAVAKGMEAKSDGSLEILPEVTRSELPADIRESVSLAAIGGPCIAGELAGRRQSCVYFGCREIESARELAEMFRTDYYHVWATNDILGLEIAVAMKNAYATGVGIALGMMEHSGGIDSAGAYMHNLAAALFAQGCIEMQRMLELTGSTAAFAYGLPGAGDFYVTSQGGRSTLLGKLLGNGISYPQAVRMMDGETLEAALFVQQMARALPLMEARGELSARQMPFMQMLIDVIVNDRPVAFLLDQFFEDCCV
jgi:glycerol-3-phosphate dehydrogenase (NAD(P)+)